MALTRIAAAPTRGHLRIARALITRLLQALPEPGPPPYHLTPRLKRDIGLEETGEDSPPEIRHPML